MSKILIIGPKYRPINDGLSDHTYYLHQCWKKEFPGDEVIVLTSKVTMVADESPDILRIMEGWSIKSLPFFLGTVAQLKPDKIVIQYVAQMYGRAGLNFTLPLFFLGLKINSSAKIYLLAHELHHPFGPKIKDYFLGFSHFFLISTLGLMSDHLFTTTERFKKSLSRFILGVRQVDILAVGPNVTPNFPISEQELKLPSLNDRAVEILLFGSVHPSREYPKVLRQLTKIYYKDSNLFRLTVVGPTKEECQKMISDVTGCKELLQNSKFYKNVAEADLVPLFLKSDLNLCYFIDGISTRRGSFVTPLWFGLPCLSTISKFTDSILKISPSIDLTPVPQFLEQMEGKIRLYKTKTPDEVLKLRQEARRFALEHFDWRKIVNTLAK